MLHEVQAAAGVPAGQTKKATAPAVGTLSLVSFCSVMQ